MDIDHSSQASEDNPQPYQVSSDLWMVPCLINHKTHVFTPLPHPPSSTSSPYHLSKLKWGREEDEVLKGLVEEMGTKQWAQVAETLNRTVHSQAKVRHGKQCRERWLNHLNPELKKGNWSCAEDLIVLLQQQEIGNRWSDIAKLLPGRNENSVKNRWKSMIRKAEKKLPPGYSATEALIREKKRLQMSSPRLELTPLTATNTPPFGANPTKLPSFIELQTQLVTSVRRTLMSVEQWPWPAHSP